MAFSLNFLLGQVTGGFVSGDIIPPDPGDLPSLWKDETSGTAKFPYPPMPIDSAPSTYGVEYPIPISDAVPNGSDDPLQLPQPNPSPSTYDQPFSTGLQSTQQINSSALQKFLSEVKKRDWAFQSKYKITLPVVVGNTPLDLGTATGEMIQLYCEGATLPGVSHTTKPYHFYGPDFHRPVDVSYGGESLQLVFLMDQDFNIRRFFDSWVRLINDPISFQFKYPKEYLSSAIVIKQLKKRGEDLANGDVGVYSVRLVDAFPINVSPMTLNYGSNDIHRLVVTLAFSRWIPAYGDQEPPMSLIETSGSSSGQIIPN